MQCYWQFQFQSFTISNYQALALPLTIGHMKMKQIHFHSFMAIGPSSRPTFRSFCMLLQLAFHAVVPTLLKTHCNFIETIERFTAYAYPCARLGRLPVRVPTTMLVRAGAESPLLPSSLAQGQA